MKLYNINGRLQYKNVRKYLVDWDSKSRSKIQFQVKSFLKEYWESHVVYEEFPVYGTRMKVDILNATKRMAVEVNGKQHSTYNKFFHNNSRLNFLKSIKRDYAKSSWLESNDFKLIEIEEHEVKMLTPAFFLENFDVSL